MSRSDHATRKAACTSLVLAGTVVLSCVAPAHAGKNDGFREFKHLNPGIRGRALRSLWDVHTGNVPAGNPGDRPPITILPIFPSNSSAIAVQRQHTRALQMQSAGGTVRPPNRSFQANGAGEIIGMNSGVDSDLGSADRNIKLGNKLFPGVDSVTLQTGDTTLVNVTAAGGFSKTPSFRVLSNIEHLNAYDTRDNVRNAAGSMDVASSEHLETGFEPSNLRPGFNGLLSAGGETISVPQAITTDLLEAKTALVDSGNALKLDPAINVRQANVNIYTADQATIVSALMESDEDSYYVSTTPMSMICPGSLCTDEEFYGAVTTNGGTADSKVPGVSHLPLNTNISLKEGKTVFIPREDTVVETPVGPINLRAGSISLVSCNDEGVAIFNVHDSARNSVSITVDGKKYSVCPGRHVLITKSGGNGDFASANHIEAIVHRGVTTGSIGKNLTMHSSEFSTLSAMASVLPLRAVFTSKHPHSRKLADRMLKTTAVLLHLNSGGDDFRYFVKPHMTALVD